MTKNKIFLNLMGAVALGAVVFTIYRIANLKKTNTPGILGQFQTTSEKPANFTALNGQKLPEEISKKRPLAVIIENYIDARPQSGLHQADIVYETLAEGGVTRFLALYQTKVVDKVGPVRSARPYFAQIANNYQALFAHVGGSDEVITDLKANKYPKLFDANEYYNEKTFLRGKKNFAPHNIFTDSKKLTDLLTVKNANQPTDLTSWTYGEIPGDWYAPEARSITADFSLKNYSAKFDYDTASDTYLRSQGGSAHIDAETKTRIAPKNVIVINTSIKEIPNDPKLRVTIDTKSGGKVSIFRNGRVIEGVWKTNETGGFNFYTLDNKDIPLAEGQTWAIILPNDKQRLIYN